MRKRGLFSRIPDLELPVLELSIDEETVLRDYLRNSMEHVEAGHSANCTYTQRHCASRTGLDQTRAWECTLVLVDRALIVQVGELDCGYWTPAAIYAPREDTLDLILDVLINARSSSLTIKNDRLISLQYDSSDDSQTISQTINENDQRNALEGSVTTIETDSVTTIETRTETDPQSRTNHHHPVSVTASLARSCTVCGRDISHRRADAKTCSSRCRVRRAGRASGLPNCLPCWTIWSPCIPMDQHLADPRMNLMSPGDSLR